MKNSLKLTPIFVAACVAFSAVAPQAALAGGIIRSGSVPAGAHSVPAPSGRRVVQSLADFLIPATGASFRSQEAAAVAGPAAPAAAAIAVPEVMEIVVPSGETAAAMEQFHALATSAKGHGPAGRAARVVGNAAPIFGRLGLTGDLKPVELPNGRILDSMPTNPSPDRVRTIVLQDYSLPGAQDVGGGLDFAPHVLAADPSNMDAVVAEIRSMIDADPARYGVSSADLRLIHVKRFEAAAGLDGSIFVYFRQVRDNLVISGSGLSFTIKVSDGKSVMVAQDGQLFPQLDVDTEVRLTDDQVRDQIAERTGIPPADVSSVFDFFEEKIIYAHGSWRRVKLFVADGLPVMVAVDVSSGLVFVWDERAGLKDESSPLVGVTGTMGGKAVDKGPIMTGAQVSEIALPFLEVKIGGKSYVTGMDGRFAADSGFEAPSEALELTATLSGPYVKLVDADSKTLAVKVSVKAGDNQVVFNPAATLDDENSLAQVNAFHKVNVSLAFLRDRKLTNDRMDKRQIVVRTNIDEDCNAYYTPGRPSLNFFRSSKDCANTAYDTVAEHENGHYWHDMITGILDGALSEGWGDILSMFRLNNPIVGEHFLKVPRKDGTDYVRHGENQYQYNKYDEVHDQGQAWGGFAWKLRRMLITKLGYEQGAAVAEALILPVMFAAPSNIPAAVAQVLVNAMKSEGTIVHEAEIREAARIHAIPLPSKRAEAGFVAIPIGLAASFVERPVVPSWFEPSGLSFDMLRKGQDGFRMAVLRQGRFELDVFLDGKGGRQAIFIKRARNPMAPPEHKEEIGLTTEASRRAVSNILLKTQAAKPVVGEEKAVLDEILAALETPPASAEIPIPVPSAPALSGEARKFVERLLSSSIHFGFDDGRIEWMTFHKNEFNVVTADYSQNTGTTAFNMALREVSDGRGARYIEAYKDRTSPVGIHKYEFRVLIPMDERLLASEALPTFVDLRWGFWRQVSVKAIHRGDVSGKGK